MMTSVLSDRSDLKIQITKMLQKDYEDEDNEVDNDDMLKIIIPDYQMLMPKIYEEEDHEEVHAIDKVMIAVNNGESCDTKINDEKER